MAGFRDFQTGEVLTAANVDDFLAKQAVMKFADAAARDTALGTAVGGGNALREGMTAYLDDADELQVYDGTAWGGVGGGVIIAVKHALFTGTQTASVAGGSSITVTGLSVTHEVADPANKLVISAFIGTAENSDDRRGVALGVSDGSGLIGAGDSAGSRISSTVGGRAAASGLLSSSYSATFVHTPGSGSKTYTVEAINEDGSTATLYINRGESDASNETSPRTASGLVVMEVKV